MEKIGKLKKYYAKIDKTIQDYYPDSADYLKYQDDKERIVKIK